MYLSIYSIKNLSNRQKMFLAKSVKTDLKILLYLAKDPNPFIRMLVAKNPSINDEIQKILLNDHNIQVRLYLTFNPNIKPFVMYESAKEFDGYIRMIATQYYNIECSKYNNLTKEQNKQK